MSDASLPGRPVLSVCGLCKTYRSGRAAKEVLKGVTFDLPAGQIVALLGANGAGKTTLVNIASTLVPPSGGRVEVCGLDVVHQPRAVREHISLTGQFAAVDQELTGRENLVFFARLHGMTRRRAITRADELLERFRLRDAARQRVGEYSGGMRRRLDIAASLVVQPTLLFLDEPTTGLDPLSRWELRGMAEQLRDCGVAILLTTQYLDEAERLADDVVLIRDGQMVLQGPPGQIRQRFGHPVCSISLEDPTMLDSAEALISARVSAPSPMRSMCCLPWSWWPYRRVPSR